MNGFTPCYRGLCAALIKHAYDDIRIHCEGRINRDCMNNGKTDKSKRTRSAQTAARALAWIAGLGPKRFPVQIACDVLNLDHDNLIYRVEKIVDPTRFRELRAMTVDAVQNRAAWLTPVP